MKHQQHKFDADIRVPSKELTNPILPTPEELLKINHSAITRIFLTRYSCMR